MDENECKQCAKCCPVLIFFWDWYSSYQHKRIRPVLESYNVEDFVIPFTESGKCCFLTEDNRCNVYENRPEMCRNYSCNHDDGEGEIKSWSVRTVDYGLFKYNVTLKLERIEIKEEP